MNKRVLVCDDEIPIVRTIGLKLQQAGFHVQVAQDGEAAWELLCREKADLLITDCQMPRLDGLGLCERVRACDALRRLPIVMLTGKGFELDDAELRGRWQIVEVVPKPFSPRQLVRLVQALLESPVRENEAAVLVGQP